MFIALAALTLGQRLTRTQERALNTLTLVLVYVAAVLVITLAQLTGPQIAADNEPYDVFVFALSQ